MGGHRRTHDVGRTSPKAAQTQLCPVLHSSLKARAASGPLSEADHTRTGSILPDSESGPNVLYSGACASQIWGANSR